MMKKTKKKPSFPLFWFIQWAINNRNADEEAWMVARYRYYHG